MSPISTTTSQNIFLKYSKISKYLLLAEGFGYEYLIIEKKTSNLTFSVSGITSRIRRFRVSWLEVKVWQKLKMVLERPRG